MGDAIRFLLNDALVELRDIDPTMTVLIWLRKAALMIGRK